MFPPEHTANGNVHTDIFPPYWVLLRSVIPPPPEFQNRMVWCIRGSTEKSHPESALKSELSHPWIMPFWLSTDDLHYLTRHWPFSELLQGGHHLVEMQLIDEAGCCRDDADGLLGQEELHHPLVAWGPPGG